MAAAPSRKLSTVVAWHHIVKGIALLIVAVLLVSLLGNSHADKLTTRSLQISNPLPAATSNYEVSFTINSPDAVGSVKLLFCDNDPIETDPCSAPSGFDVSQATLTLQNGLIDMSIQSATANSIVLTRVPLPVSNPLAVIFTLNNVINPSNIGSYYARVATYGSTDATGSSIDYGGLAFSMNSLVQISTKVPPYLLFCSGVTIPNLDCGQASGDYLNLGQASASSTRSASSQLLVATNAANGYNMQVAGITLTSGNNVIPALASPDVSRPGTDQFGINLRANQDPAVGSDPIGPGSGIPAAAYGVPNVYMFKSDDSIASNGTTEDYREFTVSYLVNVASSQAAGIYATTILYVCTPNF